MTVRRPSGEKATELTEFLYPIGDVRGGDAGVEAPISPISTMLSQVPEWMECARPSREKLETMKLPSEEKPTDDTSFSTKVLSIALFSTAPLTASQSLRVWSSLPETMRRP